MNQALGDRIPRAKFLLGLLVAATLAGCSGADGSQEAVRPDVPSGTQPFDTFLGDELSVVDYAIGKEVARCMAQRGYSQLLDNESPQRTRALDHLRITLNSFGPTTEEAARRLGYGDPPVPQVPSILSHDASFDLAREGCERQAWTALGNGSRETFLAYLDLGNQVYGRFTARLSLAPRMRELLGKRVDCLAREGFPVDDREAFLNNPDPARFGVTFGSVEAEVPGESPRNVPGTVEVLAPPQGERYVPTPREIDLALADVGCRRSSGFNSEIMDAVMELQASIVGEQETQLAELGSRIRELAKKASTLWGVV